MPIVTIIFVDQFLELIFSTRVWLTMTVNGRSTIQKEDIYFALAVSYNLHGLNQGKHGIAEFISTV